MSFNCSLFSQILNVIPRSEFNRISTHLKSDYRAKGFSSWDHFVAMTFCQLAQARSLREIQDGLRSCEGKMKHLGLKAGPCRSTLSYANSTRPWQLFQQLFYVLLERCQQISPRKKFRFKNKLLSLDSTTIELCSSMFDWAQYRQTKGAVKLHLLLDHDGYLPVFAYISDGNAADVTLAQVMRFSPGSIVVLDRGYTDYKLFSEWTRRGIFFVTRQKENADIVRVRKLDFTPGTTVLADEVVRMNPFTAGRPDYPDIRRVTIWVEEKQQTIQLLTNNFKLAAATIAAIYKERWQVELFFKALKQQLKIKTFVGTSCNAVHIQIWTALLSLLLLRYLQFRSKFSWALANLVALLRWNLFAHKDLWEWINRPFDAPPEQQQAQMELILDSSG